MKPLEYPNHHHVNAAAGWLELGDAEEARVELDKIPEAQREHSDVLAVRWRLFAFDQDWSSALEVARRHVLVRPNAAEAWINQSYALHELKRTDEAFRELRQVVDRFKRVGTIPYNLACYTCQMGLLDESMSWLRRAGKVLGKDQVIQMASNDPDLAAIESDLTTI